MHLYLVRHGLASWPAWNGQDAERPLTPEGEHLIEAAGAGLARRHLPIDAILHSPLIRARQTAEILARCLGRSAHVHERRALGPSFDLAELKRLLREHPHAKALMLVGHNPDMAEIVAALTEQEVRFKEGTVACVRIKRNEPDQGTLDWLATAEELAAP